MNQSVLSRYHRTCDFDKIKSACTRKIRNNNMSLCTKVLYEEFMRLRDVSDGELFIRERWEVIRERNCRNAYKLVPSWIKDKVLLLFHRDFELFGYNVLSFV